MLIKHSLDITASTSLMYQIQSHDNFKLQIQIHWWPKLHNGSVKAKNERRFQRILPIVIHGSTILINNGAMILSILFKVIIPLLLYVFAFYSYHHFYIECLKNLKWNILYSKFCALHLDEGRLMQFNIQAQKEKAIKNLFWRLHDLCPHIEINL